MTTNKYCERFTATNIANVAQVNAATKACRQRVSVPTHREMRSPHEHFKEIK